MLRLRLFVIRDPDAEARGYSYKGIKIPLTTFCPIAFKNIPVISYDGTEVWQDSTKEYWAVPTYLLIRARPSLSWPLRKIDTLYLPTTWCDVAPVDSLDEILR